jgi:membrane protease YdiL (CAAX protease family)
MAYAFSWAVEIPIALSVRGILPVRIPLWLHYMASFGPLAAALLVSAVTEGMQGCRTLLGRILDGRVAWPYYAFAVGGPLALFGLALALQRVFVGTWPALSLLGQPDYLPYIGPFATLGLWVLTYGLGEETGWRGFALPRLQRTRSATTSTLILWALWAGWHLPAFFYRDTYIAMGVMGFPMFAFSLLFAAMVFTWLYNSSRGSVLIVILFHAMFNWLSVSEAGGSFAPMIMTIPVIAWAVLIPRIYGTENASPLRRQTA